MQPTPDEIRLQLDRIVASRPFANSDRLSRFLKYVVERTLAGEGDRLKEYVIGTEVFDRGERYDPRIDSIVRVEAGRLRAKLDEYYSRHGVDDEVVVRIRRGRYAPEFERRTMPGSAVRQSKRRLAFAITAALLVTGLAAWRASSRAAPTAQPAMTIAVLPFTSYSPEGTATRMAARLTDGVTSELARLGTIEVVSHTSALQFAHVRRPLREVAQTLDADVVMEGSLVVEGDRARVDARLVDGRRDRKMWVERFEVAVNELGDLQRRIATAAAAAATGRGR